MKITELEEIQKELSEKGELDIFAFGKLRVYDVRRRKRIRLDGANAGFKVTDEWTEEKQVAMKLSKQFIRNVKELIK